ncbi:MAG: lysoplasmalogenase [Aurantibacter sp.]
MKKSILLWCFALVLILELISISNPDWVSLRIVTKPLLASILLFYFLLHRTDPKTKLWISFALFFSLLGDILLLLTDRSENYFMFGLISFLLAHIFYIVQFSRKRNKNLNILRPLVPLFIFGGLFFYFLKDSLGAMRLPVSIYIAVILTMAFFAFLRKGSVPKKSFDFVLMGAILFLISDGILAIDKFQDHIPLSGVCIMGTYGLAQLFIILGILKEQDTKIPRVP